MKKGADKATDRISEDKLIDIIMTLLRLNPELVKSLPAGCTRRQFWVKTLHQNADMHRMVATLCELPAFTNLRPKRDTAKAWQSALDGGWGGDQAGSILREIVARAMKWLDRELADGRAFIAGETYSIADIVAQTTIDFAAFIGLETPADTPHLAAWRERVGARPSASA